MCCKVSHLRVAPKVKAYNYKGLADQGLLRQYTENTQACPRKNKLRVAGKDLGIKKYKGIRKLGVAHKDQGLQGLGDQALLRAYTCLFNRAAQKLRSTRSSHFSHTLLEPCVVRTFSSQRTVSNSAHK